ncbi:O-antigen ligase family protein [Mumia sp. Pv 4-285]|uniref:O-antigen ligase family protein n=1 Tax=Mumia qirimensis TaxID=3234852 RepID=UPI00351D2D0C
MAQRTQSTTALLWSCVPLGVAATGAVLAFQSPVAAAVVAALALAVLAAVLLRLTALDVLVVLMPINVVVGTSTQVNVSPADVWLVMMLGGLLFFPTFRLDQRVRAFLQPLGVCALLFVAVALLGLSLAAQRDNGTDALAGVFDTTKVVIGFVYLAVVATYSARALGRQDYRFLTIWVVAATSISVVASVGTLVGGPLEFMTDYSRATGTFENPNLFASYLYISLGITLAVWVISRKPLLIAALVPQVVALALTGSRAAVLAAVVALTVVVLAALWQRTARRALVRVAALAIASTLTLLFVFPALLATPSVDRIGSGWAAASSDERFGLWRDALDMWEAHPFLGAGVGQYQTWEGVGLPPGVAPIAHSTYLSLLAETGVLGIMCFLGIVLPVVVLLVRKVARTRDAVSAFLLAGVVGVLAHAFAMNVENSRVFWALLGISTAWALVEPTAQTNAADDPVLRPTSRTRTAPGSRGA